MRRHRRATTARQGERSRPEASELTTHEKRLRLAFGVMMLAFSSPAVIQTACGGNPQTMERPEGGSADATTGEDSGGSAQDGTTDAATDGSRDAIIQLDSGAAEAPPSLCADGSDLSPAVVCGDAAVSSAPYVRCPGPCYFYVDWSCPTFARASGGCYLNATDCAQACGDDAGDVFDCLYTAATCQVDIQPDGSTTTVFTEAGPYTVACGTCAGVGRRPAGLVAPRRAPAAASLGQYFADAARLEAASVHAFRRLRRELRAHGAPRDLRRAALRAEQDEVRHARTTARLARPRRAPAVDRPPGMKMEHQQSA